MKVFAILLLLSSSVAAAKNLVFLAGPHHSESVDVGKLFFQHATGAKDVENGLDGWVWPRVEMDLSGEEYRAFEHLFSKDNDGTKEALMTSIENAWASAEHGVIIGAEGFDNTRGNPNSSGLKMMTEIVTRLNVAPEHVHVVVIYRSPRIGQWLSIYKAHDLAYNTFVCDFEYSEHIANISMNPLMLANVFREQGWKVAVVDSGGARSKNLDVAHVVACKVLPHVECDQGFVSGLENERFLSEKSADIDNLDITGTSPEQLASAETLFRDRDCFYENALVNDGKVVLVHPTSMWTNCDSTSEAQSRYSNLVVHENFYNQLKATQSCNQVEPENEWQVVEEESASFISYFLIACLILSCLCVLFNQVARYFRRQTHYVRSPKTKTDASMWVDFAEEAFQVGNLKTDIDNDSAFTDVDLLSPPAARAAQTKSNLIKAAKSGQSVRGKYRVGLYQASPSTKNKPEKGDSQFEFKIKKLEQEFV